jgi:hypothetical protein
MVAEIIKITVNRISNAEADIYYPDFSLQSELNLQEVYEERVS